MNRAEIGDLHHEHGTKNEKPLATLPTFKTRFAFTLNEKYTAFFVFVWYAPGIRAKRKCGFGAMIFC